MKLLVALLGALLLPALCCAAAPSPQKAANANRTLVGIEYFAGWWQELPNKWHGHGWTAQEPDWRETYPERVPLLGAYNDQPTMDREIVAAADHSVDFFSILWYYAPPGGKHEHEARFLARGLETFLNSKNAKRMKFCIEYCNAAEFSAETDAEWAECIKVWVTAMKHPSYLRVGGRIVFKVHGLDQFLITYHGDVALCRSRLDSLREAVRKAGLGEMIIGGGIMSRSQIHPAHPAVKLFDYTATYMSIPEVAVRDAEYPYSTLAEEARFARTFHAADPIPWVPYLAVGWNPKPWTHPEADENHRRFFTFSTKQEWVAELQKMRDDLEGSKAFGMPLPNGGRQKVFTIYAWNEFGEGGIMAPTRGEKYAKLEAIREVFGTGKK